jgi:hypothetical protein
VTDRVPDGFPQGLSYRILDFQSGNTARATQYVDFAETMCNSTPRFEMYHNLTEMNCVPFYDKAIPLASDFTDADFEALKTEGKVACDPGPNDPVTSTQKMDLQKWAISKFGTTPTYGIKGRSEPDAVRITSANSACNNHQIVVSDYDTHSAAELCDSPTSVGPDFISTKENIYCDMCAHQMWSLCSTAVELGCFDMAVMGLRLSDLQKRGEGTEAKKYKNVIQWNK